MGQRRFHTTCPQVEVERGGTSPLLLHPHEAGVGAGAAGLKQLEGPLVAKGDISTHIQQMKAVTTG